MRRWVFSLYPSPTLLRLSPFCRGSPAHPATSRVLRSHRLHPALLRASRSRFPAVRQFGTEPQPRPEPEPRPNAGLEPTSAARSRFRPPRPVRRSSRLRLRRQSLHTATTRQPVTSNPITARKAVASPAATAQTRAGTRTERWTSAAHSRFRPPRPVRQSSRLRLRRQPLHTATIRRPVTSCPITARKAVASPTATAQPRAEPSRNPDRTPDWSRTSAARSRFRSPRPVRRSSRLHPAAGLYYKRSFIARHPSQPDNDMRSALAALRSRTRALPPPSLPLAAEHEPFPPSPRSASRAASLAASRAQKNARTLPCGRRFHRKRENYFSFFSAFSIAAFRAARPAISPRVVFSTEALIFFTVDFVASAAARFSAFSAAISAFLASE